MWFFKKKFFGPAFMLTSSFFIYNAVWGQEGPHPAPLFAANKDLPKSLAYAPPEEIVTQAIRPQPAPRKVQTQLLSPSQAEVKLIRPQRVDLVNPTTLNTQDQQSNPVGQKVIQSVQDHLYNFGFYTGDIDGLDGPKTRTAVTAYQKAAGLKPTGVITLKLRDHIARSRAKADARARGETRENTEFEIVDKRIWTVQNVLAELGYAPGPLDGKYGSATREAIKRFEADRSLPVTGKINSALTRELKRVSGVEIPQNS